MSFMAWAILYLTVGVVFTALASPRLMEHGRIHNLTPFVVNLGHVFFMLTAPIQLILVVLIKLIVFIRKAFR